MRNKIFKNIICQSRVMETIFDTMLAVAEKNIDVFITGETGTGKELVARYIHETSLRKNENYVTVDCGALSETLFESELFGYEKGAFTGANIRRKGLFESAHKGSIFFDEVGEIPVHLQPKILRTIQEKKIRRIGGAEETKVDFRLISATNRNIKKEIVNRRFREDLYYRLNVASIILPPLRERPEDIPLLSEYFLKTIGKDMGNENIKISSKALNALCEYYWPGNVRELQNLISNLIVMSKNNLIDLHNLPDEIIINKYDYFNKRKNYNSFFKLRKERMLSFEKEYFVQLLNKCGGDVVLASKESELPRGTLYRLLKNHNIDPDNFRN